MAVVSPTPASSMPEAPGVGTGAKRLTRSRGIEVPDLVGKPAAGSVAELRRLGLKPNSVPEPVSDPTHAGMVIAQEPAAGEFVPANTRVRIEIGDHSLFDARKYELAPQPDPAVEELPQVVSAHVEAGGDPEPWLSYESIRQFMIVPLTGGDQGEDPVGSRWEQLAEEHSLGLIDDPFAGVVYPSNDLELAEATGAGTGQATALSEPRALEPRWTRKQRNRALLSLAVLLVLTCLAVVPHLSPHASATGRRPQLGIGQQTVRPRVVTVTVTKPYQSLDPRRFVSHAPRVQAQSHHQS
jgi:hypothetical protein